MKGASEFEEFVDADWAYDKDFIKMRTTDFACRGSTSSLFENKKSAVKPSKRPGAHYRTQHIVVRWRSIKRLNFETAFRWN